MPYFLKDNIIFIHIPKNGGTTITELFEPHGAYTGLGWKSLYKNDFEFKHSSFLDYEKKFKEKIYDKKIFTIVRNPFDRILSYFFFHISTNTKSLLFDNCDNYHIKDMFKIYLDKTIIQDSVISFQNRKPLVRITQTSFLLNKNKEIDKNIKIFKFEQFFKKHKLKISNKSKYETFIEKYKMYDDESINIIKNYFLEDFKNFNYNTEL